MKPLKKHPKQQRMEDMVTPDGKFINKSGKKKDAEYVVLTAGGLKITYDSKGNEIKKEYFPLIPVEKVTWEGREWLRSINDPNHERHVAVVILLVASIIYCVAVLL